MMKSLAGLGGVAHCDFDKGGALSDAQERVCFMKLLDEVQSCDRGEDGRLSTAHERACVKAALERSTRTRPGSLDATP